MVAGAPRTSHNLALLAERSFERLGDHESLIFEGTHYRSGQLFDRARRAGAGLASLGICAGDRVVILMANCPEVAIAYNAIWRAGAVVTCCSAGSIQRNGWQWRSDTECSAVQSFRQ